MATAGNAVTITTAPLSIYNPAVDGQARGIFITSRNGNVLVNALGVHEVGDFAGCATGIATPFIADRHGSLGVVTVKSDSSGATFDWTLIR